MNTHSWGGINIGQLSTMPLVRYKTTLKVGWLQSQVGSIKGFSLFDLQDKNPLGRSEYRRLGLGESEKGNWAEC